MRVARLFSVAASAASLALGMLVSALPANAATPGFHAAYFSESSFLSLAPGQTGQFSVGFQNSGDQTWTRTSTSASASLHTAAPLDNTTDSSAGWAQAWFAPNIYAKQASDVVSPGQITYFTYNVVVPTSASGGTHIFYGRPVIDGVGPLEDFGYYQSVSVSVGGGLTLSPDSATLGIGRSTTFIVTNRPDNPVITWSVSGGCGTITKSGTFTASTATSAGTSCVVVASANDGTSGLANVTVFGKAASIACGADPASIFANGVATSTVKVTTLDANGNRVLSDSSTIVTLSNGNKAVGALNTVTATADSGLATALFTATNAPGSAVISASSATLGACSTTISTTLIGAVSHLTGTFNPTTIAADGTSTSILTVTAVDATGATLTSNTDSVRAALKTAGACTITSSNPLTLSSGSITFTVQATHSAGPCTVTLTDLTNSGIVGIAVTIQTGVVGAANKLVVTSNDSPQRLGTAVTIKVSLQDSSSQTIVTNSSESITAAPQSCGTLTTQSQVVVNGVATFQFTQSTAQVCTVTITDATNTNVNQTSAAISWN